MQVVLNLKQCEGLVQHAHEELGILMSNIHIFCYTRNIGGKVCKYMFNNLFHGAWCVIKFEHHLMHLHLIGYYPCQLLVVKKPPFYTYVFNYIQFKNIIEKNKCSCKVFFTARKCFSQLQTKKVDKYKLKMTF
jgi:hypothetical protein